jgi:transcriptional regulator with XRE-family HTH domain
MELTLGEQLKTLRRRAALSQKSIADMTGLSANTIGKIEAGDMQRLDHLILFAKALGCELRVELRVQLEQE